jgi:hypothetical protein
MFRHAGNFTTGVLAGAVYLAGSSCSPAVAEGARPNFAPNPSIGWYAYNRLFIAPPSGAGPLQQDPAHPYVSNDEFRVTGRQPTERVADLGNPILQPWAREVVRKHNEIVLSGKLVGSPTASCWPKGPLAFLLSPMTQPMYFVQGPDEVVMILTSFNDVRHIHLADKHSANVKTSWYGESIGHYEGDTLVVDTIGLNTRTFVDDYSTPHSEKLHVVERFRVIEGGKTLEAKVHVEDPGAFTMPWDGIQHYQRVEPGIAENDTPRNPISGSTDAGPLIERDCAENPFNYFGGGGDSLVPHADKADF